MSADAPETYGELADWLANRIWQKIEGQIDAKRSGTIAQQIHALLDPLSDEQKLDVLAEVKETTCFECGEGTLEKPNSHCVCWKDE